MKGFRSSWIYLDYIGYWDNERMNILSTLIFWILFIAIA